MLFSSLDPSSSLCRARQVLFPWAGDVAHSELSARLGGELPLEAWGGGLIWILQQKHLRWYA